MGLSHNEPVTSSFIFKEDYAINFKTIILPLDQELLNNPNDRIKVSSCYLKLETQILTVA